MINALLDWIIKVEINPVSSDFLLEEVIIVSLSFILDREFSISVFDIFSSECIKSAIDPSNNVKFISFTHKLYLNGDFFRIEVMLLLEGIR